MFSKPNVNDPLECDTKRIMIFNGTRSKRRGLGGKEAWAEEEALTSLRYCYFSVLRGASECTKNRSGGSLLARIVIGDDNPPWLAGGLSSECVSLLLLLFPSVVLCSADNKRRRTASLVMSCKEGPACEWN